MRYYLRTDKADEAYLYFQLLINGKRVQFKTAIKVNVNDWNNDYYKKSNALRAKVERNKMIDIENKISTLKDEAKKANKEISKADVITIVDLVCNAETNQEKRAQEEYNRQLEEAKKAREKEAKRLQEEKERLQAENFMTAIDTIINKSLLTNETMKQYRQTRKHVAEYLNYKKKKSLSFRSINKAFYDDFVLFLEEIQGQKRNTIGKHIKNIKAVINAQPKHISELSWEFVKPATKCKKISEDVYNIALTEDEVKQITTIKLPARLDKIRNQFLLMCWTGARYSDLNEINSKNIENIGDKQILTFEAKKTDKKCYVALLPETKAILSTYDNGKIMPAIISVQKFNEALREIMGFVISAYGGSWVEVEERPRKNVRNEDYKEKFTRWEGVSTHTGRRTFITMMLNRGISETTIMVATGHRTFEEFRKYDKRSNEEKALKLLML